MIRIEATIARSSRVVAYRAHRGLRSITRSVTGQIAHRSQVCAQRSRNHGAANSTAALASPAVMPVCSASRLLPPSRVRTRAPGRLHDRRDAGDEHARRSPTPWLPCATACSSPARLDPDPPAAPRWLCDHVSGSKRGRQIGSQGRETRDPPRHRHRSHETGAIGRSGARSHDPAGGRGRR